MELILVFQILYLYYGTYSCISDLILVLQKLFLYFRSYTCITNLMPVLRDLFLCEGTRRCYKSKQIIIKSNTNKVISDLYRYGH